MMVDFLHYIRRTLSVVCPFHLSTFNVVDGRYSSDLGSTVHVHTLHVLGGGATVINTFIYIDIQVD